MPATVVETARAELGVGCAGGGWSMVDRGVRALAAAGSRETMMVARPRPGYRFREARLIGAQTECN